MPNTTSPNMSLIIPTVGQEPGPEYASDVNSSLSIIDGHNHTPGFGAPIPTAGISINADLPFGGFNAIHLRSTRFDSQTSVISGASDVNCLTVSGVDLYYIDGNGNQIRMTQSGSIAGTSGSITNLVSPASVTYVGATPAFVFQSDVSTSANLDGGSLTIRENVANAKGITINSPSALAANYSLTLPGALPAGQRFATIDNSGNIAATWNVDNSSLQVSSNLVGIKANGVQGTMLNSNTVDNSTLRYSSNQLSVKPQGIGYPSLAAPTIANGSGSLSLAYYSSYTTVATCTLACDGIHPVMIQIVATGDVGAGFSAQAQSTNDPRMIIGFAQDGAVIQSHAWSSANPGYVTTLILPATMSTIFTTPPTAANHTFSLKIKSFDANTHCAATNVAIYAKLLA